ncbi:hypothetical protein ARMSODRAFT_947365 [Armillaria solidipes]|uniref:Guanine nucleotide-binding protein subunit gamma n=1 Tax=Armillaria solidipes TaxID=1076256 RepID=A0A2H3CJ77_9AGAR|nr:hypothetical protein ARMSODRAFT_947365 [Armillaria solidipes]
MSTRTGGRQAMSELKLRRLLEHNQRLREDLARPRVRVSEASARYVLSPSLPLLSHRRSVSYGTAKQQKTTSYVSCQLSLAPAHRKQVPSVWGPVGRAEDPYGQQRTDCQCCSLQ